MPEPRMRDALIEEIGRRMEGDDSICFLTADFGSPRLDPLFARYPDRCLNVGIAEQNLINVAAGLALEGQRVFAYAIAPFLSMRCLEQIRVNLCILSQVRPLCVTLVGVGAGMSYEVSGPTHQAFEDLAILRTLPGLELHSPADWVSARDLVPDLLARRTPKYLRLDSQPLPALRTRLEPAERGQGFAELRRGDEVCLVATGYMVHEALAAAGALAAEGLELGVLDLFSLRPIDSVALLDALQRYRAVITAEEAFVGKGGLDALVANLLRRHLPWLRCEAVGLGERYSFEVGERRALLAGAGAGAASIAARARALCGLRGRCARGRGWDDELRAQ